MITLKRVAIFTFAALWALWAQGEANAQVSVLTTCGTPDRTFRQGDAGVLFIDTTGVLCTSAGGGGGGSVTQGTDPWLVAGKGTAGTPSGGVVSVQGVTSGTAIPMSAASGALAAGSFAAGAGVDGWDLGIGISTSTAATAGGAGNVAAKLRLMTSQLDQLHTDITGPIPACSASPCPTVIGAVVPFQGTTALSATNGGYQNLLQGNAVLSATNGLFNNLLQGNAVLSATNGLFANILQGNAVLSATNGSFANLLQGNAALTAANPIFSALAAATTGGCTPAKTLSAASTNSTSIKGSAGTLCKLVAINTTAALYYLKFYNTSSAPTCNSDAVVASYPVPASTTGAGVAIPLGSYGEAYTTGIGMCLTGALADNDNTNAATGVVLSYSFK